MSKANIAVYAEDNKSIMIKLDFSQESKMN